MRKTRMRVWSILLTVLMLLTLLPISAMADEAPVAMIGDTPYTSLYDAVAEAQDGDTIKLLGNASGCGIIVDSSKYAETGLTIDFNGFTYTVDESPLAGSSGTKSQCFQLLTGGKVTMKGGTVNSANPGVAMVLQNYCDLTLDGMVIDGSGMTRTDGTYTMSNNCGNVVIKDTTVIAKEGDVAFDVYGGFQEYGDVTVTVTGSSVIDGKVEVAHGSDNDNKNTLNIEGGTFNGAIDVTANDKTAVAISGGAFSSSVKDYVEDSSSAISVTDSSSTKYYVGTSEALAELIQNAAPGTTVEVQAGSIQAGQVPDGVTVVGTGSGSVTVDKDEATYTVTVIKAATCTANGIVKYTNTADPSDYYYVSIPAGHKWEFTKTNQAATCGEAGEALYTCSACKETKTEVIEATGEHNFEEKLVEATCTENAKAGRVCTVCGATDGEMVEVPGTALGHDLVEDEETLVPATCTEAGSVTLKCSREGCDHTEEKVLPATGHTPGEPEMVEPTCTESGKSVVKCAVCGEILESTDLGELAPATGHTPVAMEEVAATCATAGSTGGSICSVCETVLEEPTVVPANPEAHNYVLTSTLKAPTCTTTGIGKYVCSYCEASKYQVIAAEHKWGDGEESKAPTCTEAGQMTYTCTVCEETKTEEIAALGHSWDEGEITTPATCGAAGEKTYTCQREECGETKTEVISATGEHKYQEGYVDATCTENAKAGLVCSVCGATSGEMVEIPGTALGHELVEDEETLVPATCTEDGSVTLKCSRCDYTEEKVLPATGEHTEEVVDAKAPTCTEAGYTEGVRCSVCGETLYGMEEIPATGEHTPVTDAAVAPTCNTPGKTEGSHCSVCGEVLVAQEEIDINPEAHNYVLTSTLKAPTCTTTGIGKYVCSYCEASKYQVIAAEHKWGDGEESKAPTCTEAGQMTYTCTVCEETKTEEIAALGHSWDEGEITTPATCGAAGEKTYTCQREECGETKTEVISATGEHKYQEGYVDATCTENAKAGLVCSVCGATSGEMVEIPGTALGHELVEDEETLKPATCTEAGSVTLKCSRCDYTEEKTLDALGHTAGEPEMVEPTCTESGKSVVKCAVCGEILESDDLGDLAPATGHTPVEMEEVAATCTTAGSTGGVICSVCDTILEEPTVVPANPDAHVYQLKKTLKEPTCSAPGIGSYKCECCGKTAYLSIEPLEHTWDEGTETKPATCTEEGILTFKCEVCGATKTEQIQPTGHKFGGDQVSEDGLIVYKECTICHYQEIIANFGCEHKNTEIKDAVAATCTEDGYTGDTVCTDCGETLQTGSVIPATGHTVVNDAAVEPTCTTDGKTEGSHCSACGTVIVAQETVPATGHTEEVIPGKEATCTEAGLTEGKKCSVCGEILVAQEEIPMVPHNYVDGVCTACGAEDPDYVAPCTHETTETKNAVAATCTEDGYTGDTVCTDCGETLQTGSVIPATGHTVVTDAAVEPTCTTDGKTEGSHCSVCGTVIVAQETVPATGHTVVEVPEVPATEASAGTTAGTKCSVCGEILSGCETIPPLSHEHVWDGGVETKAPTCTEAGEKTYTCSCGETRVEAIPAKGHSYKVTVSYNSDYTEVTYTYTCSACGDSYSETDDL